MKIPSAEFTELQSLFLRFAAVDGVSLNERLIADTVKDVLTPHGVRVVEDETGKAIGGNCGNLLCFPPNFRDDQPAIILTAHLDTVQSTARLKPQIEADRITSDGTTILGGDNRMGLSILTFLLQQVAKRKIPHQNFFVVHSVAEEIGLYGAEKIDLSKYLVEGAYVFDSSRRPGIYVRECVGLYLFDASFIGKAAHAGVSPEDGINAISLASHALSKTEVGRIDEDLITNVGTIAGGVATNVVPDKVSIEGEVRSFSPERSIERLRLIEKTFRDSIGGQGSVDFKYRVDFEPCVLKPDAPLLVRLERALRAVGLTPQPIRYTGGSDANKYNAKGIAAVCLGIGAQKPHTHEEFVLLEDLAKATEIGFELIRPD
jgi:tripeptide aminopeptidase